MAATARPIDQGKLQSQTYQSIKGNVEDLFYLINQLQTQVASLQSQIKSAVNNNSGVTQEKNRAELAESNEAAARAAADATLQANITAEVARAEGVEAGFTSFNYLISQPLYFQVVADMPLKPPSNQVVVWMRYPDKKLMIQDENGNTGELLINWDSPSPQ